MARKSTSITALGENTRAIPEPESVPSIPIGDDAAAKKRAYLAALVAAIVADGVIEDTEILQLYELFALFDTEAAERQGLSRHFGWMVPNR